MKAQVTRKDGVKNEYINIVAILNGHGSWYYSLIDTSDKVYKIKKNTVKWIKLTV